MSAEFLSSIEEIIEDARNGRMFILIDDEDRENEGDLVIPAQMATPDAINFMAKYGRGLICLALTSERVEELGLTLMSKENQSRHQTAFTVSIEARDGITTGISAADRARTVAVAIDHSRGRDDLATPGHVFPLIARDGGVLARAGHTESAVDIARLAGLNPAGVICEVMNDDGTMARLPDLIAFAQFHGLKVAAIRDLIAYRRRHDHLVECVSTERFESIHGGDWQIKVYNNKADYAEHIVLVKGNIENVSPVLVRVHVLNMFDDILEEATSRTGQLYRAMDIIGEEGTGVVLIILDSSPNMLTRLMAQKFGKQEKPAAKPSESQLVREYGIGAQILYDLGIRDMILLSNTKQTVIGLEGYGMTISGQRPIPDGKSS